MIEKEPGGGPRIPVISRQVEGPVRAPFLAGVSPASPSAASAVLVTGTAPEGASVSIFKDPACARALAVGTSGEFASPGISVPLEPNRSNALFVQAAHARGRKSPCARLTTFVHDSVAPAAPSLLGTVPDASSSPSGVTAPRVKGLSAPADATRVRVYLSPSCEGVAAASGSRQEFLGEGIEVRLSAGGVARISAAVEDAAGNLSACSPQSLTYLTTPRPGATPTPAPSTAPRPSATPGPTPSTIGQALAPTLPFVSWNPTGQPAVPGREALDASGWLVWQIPAGYFPAAVHTLTIAATGESADGTFPTFRLNINDQTVAAVVSTRAERSEEVFAVHVPAGEGVKVGLLFSNALAARTRILRIHSISFSVGAGSPSLPTPTPRPTPTPTASTPAQRLADARTILNSTCLGCHANYANYASDTDWVLAKGTYTPTLTLVVAGNPAASPLFTRLLGNGIVSANANMPVVGGALSASQVAALRAWITGMTEAPLPTAAPDAPATPPQAGSATLAALVASVRDKCDGQPTVPAALRQLNVDEIHFSLNDLLGTSSDQRALFEADNTDTDGFKNNASFLRVDAAKLNALLASLDAKVDEAFAAKAASVTCASGVSADACARTVIGGLMRKAFRREVGAAELNARVAYYDSQKALHGAADAIKLAVKTVFAAPEFLFVNTARDSQESLGATLALLLWRSAPDEQLLARASAGQLADLAELERQIERMMKDPRAQRFYGTFTGEWLGTILLQDESRIDRAKISAQVVEAMYLETNETVRNIIANNRPLSELLDGDYTFVNQALATHYGIPGVTGANMRKVTGVRRLGLLSNGGYLALKSGTAESSPTGRGNFILNNVTCTPPPPFPDGGAVTPLQNPDPDATIRENLAAHRANPVCASCHAQMDEVGLSMEVFDHFGKLRSTSENKRPIDSSGRLYDTPFADTQGLIRLLARRDEFKQCLSRKLITYATAKSTTPRDRCHANELGRGIAAVDGGGMSLLKAVLLLSLLK